MYTIYKLTIFVILRIQQMSRTTIAVDEKVKEVFDDYQYETRSKNQTEALKKLLELAGRKVEVES